MINNFISSYFTYRLLKIIAQPWESTPAFKADIIDAEGNLITKVLSDRQRKVYTPFDRIAYNIKRTLSKVPGSQNPFVRIGSAVALMREGALLESDVEEIASDLEPIEEETPVNNVGSGNVALNPVPLLRTKRKKLGETLNF